MSTLLPPTKRQLFVHAFMLRFRDKHGIWPSMREIAESIGVSSTNAVHCHLVALKKKGLAAHRRNAARGWIALPLPSTEHDELQRCEARSPGGSTDEGQLPAKGTQCGLPAGHDGEHCVLIPTGAPWFPRPDIKEAIARSSIGAGLRNIRENGIEAELADLEHEMRPRYRR